MLPYAACMVAWTAIKKHRGTGGDSSSRQAVRGGIALRAFLLEAGFSVVAVGSLDGVHHGAYRCGKFRATRAG